MWEAKYMAKKDHIHEIYRSLGIESPWDGKWPYKGNLGRTNLYQTSC